MAAPSMPAMPQPVRAAPAGVAAVGLTAGATAALIVIPPSAPTVTFLSLLLAAAAGAIVLTSGRAQATLRTSPRVVLVAGILLLLVAVAYPPRLSRQLYTYAAQGRMIAEHGASPYERAPASLPSDPYTAAAPAEAAEDRSVYGPLWTGISATVAWIAGDDVEDAAKAFQVLAALAALAALLLLAARARDAAALTLLGLQPVTAAVVVNGGHNDALVGLATLGGALLAPRRPVLAGLVLGLGASVKIVGVVPLLALAAWSWRRSGGVAGARLLGTGTVVVVVGYLVVGIRDAVDALLDGAALRSFHSMWAKLETPGEEWPTALAFALIALLTAVYVLARARTAHADELAGNAFVPYLVAAPYLAPWYAWWAMPALAAWWRKPLTWVVVGQALLLMALYADRRPGSLGAVDRALDWVRTGLFPALQVALVAVLAVTAVAALVRRAAAQRRAGMTSEA